MWVMLNDAWLSIVADREDPEFLLVRSRRRGDVARIFGVEEFEDIEADYTFRAFIHRDQVAGAMSREVLKVDYPNFKNSVKDNQLHKAYSSVWSIGWRLQLENQKEGKLRRTFHGTVPSFSEEAEVWPPLNCESCGAPLDHAFHAPVIGQPPGECETCWEQGLYGNHQEDDEEEGFEEEGRHQEGRDQEDFSFEELEELESIEEENDEENAKVADLFARRSRT